MKQKEYQSVNKLQTRTKHLSEEQITKLKAICYKYPKLFAEQDERLSITTAVKTEIKTTTDDPIYTRFYPYPMTMKDEVEKQIKELLKQGIINRSKSPYNSPIWTVPKKMAASNDKKYRMVVDYRKLNAVTTTDRYPIPEINEVLANLGQNKWLSVLDLKSGFHEIKLKEEDT